MTACLRSILKHSAKYDLQTIVVDNGSKDESLDYLRSLSWIDLIERPDEVPANWPLNVFTAWDRGLTKARGEFFVTMHSDVFVKDDNWLETMVWAFQNDGKIAATGAWKQELDHPLYLLQKRVTGYALGKFKNLFGRKKKICWKQNHYPRDYCAMYRAEVVRKHDLTFCPVNGCGGGGFSIAKQLWDAGYNMGMIPVRKMAEEVYHVAHGTAAAVPEKPLNHKRAQKKVENKVTHLFKEQWIQNLLEDDSLDGAVRKAA